MAPLASSDLNVRLASAMLTLWNESRHLTVWKSGSIAKLVTGRGKWISKKSQIPGHLLFDQFTSMCARELPDLLQVRTVYSGLGVLASLVGLRSCRELTPYCGGAAFLCPTIGRRSRHCGYLLVP